MRPTVVTDAQLIRDISRSVSRRLSPKEFYRRGREVGRTVRTQWAAKGQAERRAKRKGG